MQTLNLTVDELHQKLDYDPSTGMFQWRNVTRKRCHSVGWFKGSRNKKGYLNIKIGRVLFQAHRLAWLHVHGNWPQFVIDHINRDKSDNRIENLRDVTVKENLANRAPFKKRAPMLEVES
jgi:hypothetical protein